jgi:Uma2 family endonuclease
MTQQATQTQVQEFEIPAPDVSQLVTEDDTPVDNIFSERQMRLLPDALYASWEGPGDGRPFIALADVALYYTPSQPPYVPDVLVSLDVQFPENVWKKEHRSYFMWLYGKPPDIVVEIVSNREGGELTHKLRGYARLGIPYYIVYDPELHLGEQPLYVHELRGGRYVELREHWLEAVGLGVTLWRGEYEDLTGEWLRWCDIDGELYPTGAEAAQQAQNQVIAERARAEQEYARAEQEYARAEQERERAERLAAQLRALGIEPDV